MTGVLVAPLAEDWEVGDVVNAGVLIQLLPVPFQ